MRMQNRQQQIQLQHQQQFKYQQGRMQPNQQVPPQQPPQQPQQVPQQVAPVSCNFINLKLNKYKATKEIIFKLHIYQMIIPKLYQIQKHIGDKL